MPHAVEVLSRPFAAFFEEAFTGYTYTTVERPRVDTLGTAILPVDTDNVNLGLCCECLSPREACSCD